MANHENHPWPVLLSFSCIWAYLLIFGGVLDYVVHQDRQQFLYSINTSSVSAILCGTVYRLSGSFGLFCPFSRHRVYHVEYAKFVCSRGFLEMSEELLDEYWFGLWDRYVSDWRQWMGSFVQPTSTCWLQSVVMLWIREPDTPGGFNCSIAWRPASRSATAEDMMQKEMRWQAADSADAVHSNFSVVEYCCWLIKKTNSRSY